MLLYVRKKLYIWKDIYNILKSLFRSGFNRNIYLIIAHQTEDYLPMTLACMKAAKKLTFEYLEETQGFGWWGNNVNKDFYENLSVSDNPWNWIRVIRGAAVVAGLPSDHAGIHECSSLEYLYPARSSWTDYRKRMIGLHKVPVTHL